MKQTRNHYSQEFRSRVLEDYFQSRKSQAACARDWQIKRGTLTLWLRTCRNEKKVLSLPPKSTHMDPKDQVLSDLRSENERLRQEVEYQKLKVAGYERLIEIVKLEDGIDLLKKDGAKQ